MDRTAHGELVLQWERMPTPLAAVGLLIGHRDAEYLHRIFVLMESTVGLGIAYGLALARHRGETVDPSLLDGLERASFGQRGELLRRLYCGWDLKRRDPAFVDIVSLALPDQLPKRKPPTTAQALAAIVRARNELAHPTLAGSVAPDSAGAVVDAIVTLAQSNELFQRRLLRVDGFGATEDGRPGVIATSMTGAQPLLYDSGRVLTAPGLNQVGELFLRLDDSVLPLGPFVFADGNAVFFLAERRNARNVYWSPATDEHRSADLAPAPGQHPPMPVAVPTPATPATVDEPAGNPARVRLIVSLCIVVVIAVFLIAVPLVDGSPDTEQVPTVEMERPSVVHDQPSSDLARLFGLGAEFGQGIESLEGRVVGNEAPVCDGATWTVVRISNDQIPSHEWTSAWVDEELGLLEFDAYTTADLEGLSSWVTATLGRVPTSTGRFGPSWENGDVLVTVAVARNERTLLRVAHRPKRTAFEDIRNAICN